MKKPVSHYCCLPVLPGLLLIVSLFCLSACKKDNYSLPPETQTGAGTFSCKINGRVWVPNGSDGYSGQNTKCFYQYIYPTPVGFVFSISAAKYDNNPLEGVQVSTDSIRLFQGMTVSLGSGKLGESGKGRFTRYAFNSIDVKYETSDISKGELILTRFDETNRIASGTFWFDAANASGEIVHVTEGRFDVKFTR